MVMYSVVHCVIFHCIFNCFAFHRKWGVRETPLNELFETLSELRDILVTFYTKVSTIPVT